MKMIPSWIYCGMFGLFIKNESMNQIYYVINSE